MIGSRGSSVWGMFWMNGYCWYGYVKDVIVLINGKMIKFCRGIVKFFLGNKVWIVCIENIYIVFLMLGIYSLRCFYIKIVFIK